MNWKAISFAMLGIGGFIGALIDSAADRQLYSDVNKKAVLDRDEKTVEKLDEALKNIELVDELNKRERKEIGDEVKKWKLANDYDGRLNRIHLDAENEIREFKESINYFDRKQEIEDKAESALDIFKESIEYDYEVEQLEDSIENAKLSYKKRSKLYDLAGHGDNDISDTVGELKKAEKEKMENAVKKAEDQIQELKNKVNAEKTKIDRLKNSELRTLENETSATSRKINQAAAEASDVIRKEFAAADADIRKKITDKRSDAENEAMDLYQESKDILEEQKIIDAKTARDLYANTPMHEKWANWFNAAGWPKWLVIGLGSLPFIPAGYLLFSYTKFLVQTVKAM